MPAPVPATIVHVGASGKLVYLANADGDILPDFSTCGYHGGGVALPQLPVRLTLHPGARGEDDQPRIQAALDQLAALPADHAGLRGALLLTRGRYRVDGTLTLSASGMVLRGEGQGEDGTVLEATLPKQYDVIMVSGRGKITFRKQTMQPITDERMPSGATSCTIANASGFAVHDTVIVYRPSTKEWLADLKMDRLTETYNDPKLKNWTPGAYDSYQRRTIVAISGNRITLDSPNVQAIERRYGGGSVFAYDAAGQIEEDGVEDLRVESAYDPTKIKGSLAGLDALHAIRHYCDEDHAWVAVVLDNVRNAWVQRVTTVHTGYGCAHTWGDSDFTTIQDCTMIDPVATDRGGRKYSFVSGGQRGLFLRCYSRNSRHDFAFSSRAVGPTAFVECCADFAGGTTEPHHRYATGGLFDNVALHGDGFFLAINRGNSGSGHGWAGAQMVFWNCFGQSIYVMKPPAAQNYAIGWMGPIAPTLLGVDDAYAGQLGWIHQRSTVQFTYQGVPVMGDGYIESPDRPVTPRSLYFQQLADRLGPAAVAGVSRRPGSAGSP